ncbi:hypothetical protein LSCM1_02589 [Leishmania martiniquensis]|uniref:diacylglycerol O-acyltransferase n=1 Tax=Leishmania martiniquensis TaxID=1580590 RepID=A0A836KEA6_9TRYP|nr:hypothetical protein LSCM1_02589 [Leishmania martiniquensis]
MYVALCLSLFAAAVMLPLLSFLRSNAILRGGVAPAVQGSSTGSESTSIVALCGGKPPPSPALTVAEAAQTTATWGKETAALGSPAFPNAHCRNVLLQVSGQASGAVGTTSAWDRRQLTADDNIRLVFLFTLAVPVFTFWYWNLRTLEPKAVRWIYGHGRSANKTVTIDESPQTFFRVSLAALLLVSGCVTLVWYASFIYLNHREKDVSLKRHSKTWWDRAVNWFKFRVYRRCVDCQCRWWKHYFSLELVAAYGPLPLFLFPDEEGGVERGDPAMEKGYSSLRALGGAPEARHSPHPLSTATALAHDLSSPLDTEVATMPACPRRESPIGLRRHAQGIFVSPPAGDASARNLPKSDVDSPKDDWDEEERTLLRPRHSNAFLRPMRLSSKQCLDEHGEPDELHVRQPSASRPSQQFRDRRSPSQPPAMRRAHYFFAAHPHGILPWCCCVNMISNVAHRDGLFLDNREHVLRCRGVPQMSVASEMMSQSSPMSPLPHAATIATASNARPVSPSSGLTTSLPASLPIEAAESSTGVDAAVSGVSYAVGRYYVYDPFLRKFVLRLGKDEALPATFAAAEVYRERLRYAQTKEDASAAAAAAGTSSAPRRLRIRIRAVAASFPFYVPIMREIYMFYGYMDASYDTCKRVLLYNNSTHREREGAPPASAASSVKDEFSTDAKGEDKGDGDSSDDDHNGSTLPHDLNHLLLFPGGASEALLSSAHGPARLLLRRRKGFLRLTIHTQSGLVPVYTFGETDYFEQCSSATPLCATPADGDENTVNMPRRGAYTGTLLSPKPAGGGAALQTVAEVSPLSQARQQVHCHSPQSGSAVGQADGTIACSAPPPNHSGDGRLLTGATPANAACHPCQQPPLGAPFTSPMSSPIAPELLHPAAMLCKRHHHESREDQEGRLLKEASEEQERDERALTPLCMQPMPLSRVPESGDSAAPRKEAKTATPLCLTASLAEEPVDSWSSFCERSAERQAFKKATASSPPAVGRFWRFVHSVQRLFQETFGLSLPVVKNIIPRRVTGATVVGRPIYFQLPPDLQRMYTDPTNYFDKKKEMEVLHAAQEVYVHELQELFLRYAPRYLKDPRRRRLEII